VGLFDKIKEPIILKEDSSAQEQLNALECLLPAADAALAPKLERDIAALKAGIFGENTILFELKNSHIPMYVLHDLYLEYEGLSAQIDFLIITRKYHFVIECKNLYGNITITDSGDFIRYMGNRKEGIYSPITQGKRHLELIKQIRRAQKSNFITKALFERNFYTAYRSVVVLANPKTILNDKYAPKEVKKQVLRADQLIDYIRKINSDTENVESSENEMTQLANFFMSIHRPCPTDYTEKYRSTASENTNDDIIMETPAENPKTDEPPTNNRVLQADMIAEKAEITPTCPKCGAPMVKRKATKGKNEGSEFWGCSTFPKCRGIINMI